MTFLPYDKIVLKTKLTDKQIVSILNSITDTDTKFSFKKLFKSTNKTYFGSISDNNFEIKRIIYYKNSFLPISFGTIEKTLNGSTINIIMRMHMAVNIGISIIFSFFLFFSIISITLIDKMSNNGITHFIPIIILFLIYAIVMFFYKLESIQAKKDLIMLFSADIEK